MSVHRYARSGRRRGGRDLHRNSSPFPLQPHDARPQGGKAGPVREADLSDVGGGGGDGEGGEGEEALGIFSCRPQDAYQFDQSSAQYCPFDPNVLLCTNLKESGRAAYPRETYIKSQGRTRSPLSNVLIVICTSTGRSLHEATNPIIA